MKPSKNPSGADNVQGSLAEIAWLAGVLDGDGWVGIIRAKRSGKDYYRYSAALSLMSTSWRNTEKAKNVFEAVGVNYYVVEYAPKIGTDGSPRKRKWNIGTRSNADTAKVLRLLIPHMAEKKRCGELVLEYVEWRTSYPLNPGGKKAGKVYVVGMREKAEETMELLRRDRNRHDPSTTTRLVSVSTSVRKRDLAKT